MTLLEIQVRQEATHDCEVPCVRISDSPHKVLVTVCQCLPVLPSREGQGFCRRLMEDIHVLCVELFARSNMLGRVASHDFVMHSASGFQVHTQILMGTAGKHEQRAH